MKRENIIETHKVGEGDVLLTVLIGNAQVGGSAVVAGGKTIGEGNIKQLKLGTGSELRNFNVRIKTAVADINDLTNKTSVTYKLEEGGHTTFEKSYNSEVENDGDSMVFTITFKMV